MSTTSVESSSSGSISSTLLGRVRARDDDAWHRLVHLFAPVIYHWATKLGLHHDDAVDVVQAVFSSVLTHIEKFRRDGPAHTFRGWLWRITQNQVRDIYRRRNNDPTRAVGIPVDQLLRFQTPPPEHDEETEREIDGVLWRGMELIRPRYADSTWNAFWRTAVEGQDVADVANDLGLSNWAVYKARARVLAKLREELEGLIDVDEMLG